MSHSSSNSSSPGAPELVCVQAETKQGQSNSLLPESPCIGYCSTSFGDEVCIGCGRLSYEVTQWIFMSDVEKQKIWDRIATDGTALRFRRK
jgi:hypothetical protein